MIKFFCDRCGKELRELIPRDNSDGRLMRAVEHCIHGDEWICLDCMLDCIKNDKQNGI